MNTKTVYQSIAAVGGSLVTYLFGGWSALLGVLVSFVIADYITGVLAAFSEKKLSSEIGAKGIAKKVFIFVFVALGNLADVAIGANGNIIRNAVIYFYLANELLSIIENAGRMGVPVPSVLKHAVEILNSKGEGKIEPPA